MSRKEPNPPPPRNRNKFEFYLGEKYLITTSEWFMAPDGNEYKAAYGTVDLIVDDSELGIKTNRNSTNWYVTIGGLAIAGCQIHYAIRTDKCNLKEANGWSEEKGKAKSYPRPSKIYSAD